MEKDIIYCWNGMDREGVLKRVHCRVWWRDFFTFYILRAPPRFVVSLSKVRKMANNIFFDPVTASLLVSTFCIILYIRVKNFSFTMWTLKESKDAGFYGDINLPY
jgi:hypothetical protein